jgi:acyl dehydratase
VARPHATKPGALFREHRVRARNLFRDAANRIHDDAVARQHGYAGALVAGVTIYGYLSRLVVDAWGVEWLRRGTATVRFARPVYDGDLLTLSGRIRGRSGREEAGEILAEIEARTPRGEVAATMAAGLAWGGPVVALEPRAYPAAALPGSPPPVTAEDPLGTPVLRLDAAVLERAADDLDDPSPVYRGSAGVVHAGLVLRQANRALSENFTLGPWIHVSSDVAHLDLMLLLLGLQLARLAVREEAQAVTLATAIRLLAVPSIAWVAGRLVGLEGMALAVAVLQASTPTAVTSALWAIEVDARPALVSATVVLSMVVSVVTLTILLAVLTVNR